MDISSIIAFPVTFKPLLTLSGLIILILILLIALIALLSSNGKIRPNVPMHQRTAFIAIIITLLHAYLGFTTSDNLISIILGSITILFILINSILAFSTVKRGSIRLALNKHKRIVYITIVIGIIHIIFSNL